MGLGGDLYRAVVVIHILTVVFGLGPLVWNGVVAAKARSGTPQARSIIAQSQFDLSRMASVVVYFIFVTGVAAVLMSDGYWSLGDMWVSLSMLTYIVALGISHGMLQPNARRMLALGKELAELDGAQLSGPPEQAVELADRAKRQAAMGMTLNLLTAFLVYLMVFKPGM